MQRENRQLEEKVSSLNTEVTEMKTELETVRKQFVQYTEFMQQMNDFVNRDEAQVGSSKENGIAYTKKGQQ